MAHAITLQGVNHWFGMGEARKQALFDLNLTIQGGSLTVLRGPSGSGKTTMLTLMGCLRALQAGQITLLGQPVAAADAGLQQRMRRQMGFIFQAHNLHDSLTALQNVLIGLQVHGAGDPVRQRAAAVHLLGLLGLGDRVDYLPANLSGGQKQRVAVARALVANPAIVFADEPTAALDHAAGLAVVTMLRDLARIRGTTTVMVTHDARIQDMADRIITLEDGRIVADTGA